MESDNNTTIRGTTYQGVFLVFIIVCIRILFVDLYSELQESHNFTLLYSVRMFFQDYPVFWFSIVLNVLYMILMNRHLPYGKQPLKRVGASFSFIIAFSAIITLLTNRGLLFSNLAPPAYNSQLLISFMGVALVNALCVFLLDVLVFFLQQHRTLKDEGNKKRKAQYQYAQLKQQLNPHFLFNSLNILDYLVQHEPRQRASDFIKKMAGVYRYLLDTGENKLVTVQEELRFVGMYTDLLKERFPAGLYLQVEVNEFNAKRQIIPCGLQILIENATKHNIVNAEYPLYIRIFVEKDRIVVQNNVQPRMNRDESTGIGLANIQKQYKDIANKRISIKRGKNKFAVKLPLI